MTDPNTGDNDSMAMTFSKFFEELGDSAIGLVVAGVTIGFGLQLLGDQRSDLQETNSTGGTVETQASNATADVIEGTGELASGTTTIASVIVLVLVLLALFMLRQRSNN